MNESCLLHRSPIQIGILSNIAHVCIRHVLWRTCERTYGWVVSYGRRMSNIAHVCMSCVMWRTYEWVMSLAQIANTHRARMHRVTYRTYAYGMCCGARVSAHMVESCHMAGKWVMSYGRRMSVARMSCVWGGYVSRLLQIIGLFCRILSLLYGSFTKESYHFKEPTTRGHPIVRDVWMCCVAELRGRHV